MFGLSAILRRYITGFLALALLGALWTTALGRLSDHDSAVSVLTAAGSELINPLLLSNGSGLGQDAYAGLEHAAAANPNQPVQILFIKPQVLGKEIAGKNFADGTRVIYRHVAEAYYASGPGAAFSLPAQLQQLVTTYSPFIQPGSLIPAVNGVPGAPQSGTSQSPIPQIPLPQLPSWTAPFFRVIGVTPATLTLQGHNDQLFVSRWLWIAAAVLALLLAVFSAGWTRLSSVAWAVFHAGWTVTLLFTIAAFLINSHPAQAAPYKDILGSIGSAFFPVYVTATIVGLLGIIAAFVLPRVLKFRASAPAGALASRGAGGQQHPYEAQGGYTPGGQRNYSGPPAGQSQTPYPPSGPGGYAPPPPARQPNDYPGAAGGGYGGYGQPPAYGPAEGYSPSQGYPPAEGYPPTATYPPRAPYGQPGGDQPTEPEGPRPPAWPPRQ